MPLKAQDYAAFRRPVNTAAANATMIQGMGGMMQGLGIQERKRAARAQEGLEQSRQDEVNRSAMEGEQQSRDREAARQAEDLRDIRLKTMAESHALLKAGFTKEGRARGALAGLEIGEVTTERLEREMKEDAVKRMEEAKVLDEAEAEARDQSEAIAQGELEDDPENLEGWLAATARQGEADARAGGQEGPGITGPTAKWGESPQAVPMAPPGGLPPQRGAFPYMPMGAPGAQQMQGPPPRMQMPPPGGLPPQMMRPQPQMQAPVQQPAQPAPQQAPPMPGAMPGMLPIQMDPREVQRVITEKKIVEGTAKMQAYFTKMKDGVLPHEQEVMDAMIESMPELVALYDGNTDVLMEKISQGIHTKPIFDRMMKMRDMEAAKERARIAARAAGGKVEDKSYEKGHKMVSDRMKLSKHQEAKRSYKVVKEAFTLLNTPRSDPAYLANQAKALKLIAAERDDRITDRDMLDLMKNKSFMQSVKDSLNTATWGGLGPEELESHIASLDRTLDRKTVAFGDLRKQALLVAKHQAGRDRDGTQYGKGATDSIEEWFSEVDYDMGEDWESEEAASIKEIEAQAMRGGTEGKKRSKKKRKKGVVDAADMGFDL